MARRGEGTPAERLLYALGQLYRLHKAGELPVDPKDFDVLDLARIIGVAREVELVTDAAQGRSYHFPGEVLVLNPHVEFPWRLLDIETWAFEEDMADFEL